MWYRGNLYPFKYVISECFKSDSDIQNKLPYAVVLALELEIVYAPPKQRYQLDYKLKYSKTLIGIIDKIFLQSIKKGLKYNLIFIFFCV